MKKKTNTVQHISTFLVLFMMALPSVAQSYESYIEQGLAAAQEQRYDEAIEQFRQALKAAPDDIRNALTYANIAHIQELKGEQMKALDSYDMALGIASLMLLPTTSMPCLLVPTSTSSSATSRMPKPTTNVC